MYHENIKKLAKENNEFRRVLQTGEHAQIVLMSIKEGKEIGEEVHEKTDQLFFIVEGDAEVTVEGERFGAEDGDMVFVAAGKKHNVANDGDEDLKLYTIYSPPEHEHE